MTRDSRTFKISVGQLSESLLNQLSEQNRSEHTAHGADILAVRIHCSRHREEMAKQLVGAVDKVNLHGGRSQIGITQAQCCNL